MRNEVVVHEAACVGCGVCVDVCPPDVLRMSEAGKAVTAYPDDCQACFLCVFDCAYHALEVRVSLDDETRHAFLTLQ